jgi:hypothetical protein
MQDFDAHPGRIATRSRHAGREPAADHVVGHTDDGDGLCRTLRSSDRGIAEGDNEIDILCDKLAGKRRRAVATALSQCGKSEDSYGRHV